MVFRNERGGRVETIWGGLTKAEKGKTGLQSVRMYFGVYERGGKNDIDKGGRKE